MEIIYKRTVPDGQSCLGCGKLQQRQTGPECELFREDCPSARKCASCRAAEVTGWQPIASAPKDGTEVLVLADIATVLVAHIAWWQEWEDEGWWSYIKGSVTQEKLDGIYTPTHWMPLPPAPEGE